jgi:hypothetical protein
VTLVQREKPPTTLRPANFLLERDGEKFPDHVKALRVYATFCVVLTSHFCTNDESAATLADSLHCHTAFEPDMKKASQ